MARMYLVWAAQAGRRYPQSGFGGDHVWNPVVNGTTTTPTTGGGDNTPTSIDLPEMGSNSPGSVLLGQPGGLT